MYKYFIIIFFSSQLRVTITIKYIKWNVKIVILGQMLLLNQKCDGKLPEFWVKLISIIRYDTKIFCALQRNLSFFGLYASMVCNNVVCKYLYNWMVLVTSQVLPYFQLILKYVKIDEYRQCYNTILNYNVHILSTLHTYILM